ncbi:MAG: HAD family hydrolase [Acidimicrobiaceae bacterium]|nr:HAD family hydrolase [Acidimicrobiaceae bacterium]MBT5578708.1 HAD family hydrolase [Acidimicrobiaceae bacterium]MBT5851093.1 HAD family hydrolase [Acidimicrobiaceae bacterium]
MYSPEVIDAVVFDMGGVFIVPDPVVLNRVLLSHGVSAALTGENAAQRHYAGVRAMTELLAHTDVREGNLDVWEHYDRAYFGVAGIDGDDLDVAIGARRELRAQGEGELVWRHPLAENIAGFARIAMLRPVAIVTNNNGTAIQQCLDHGICQVGEGALPQVAAIVDSGVLGISKPDPRIFEPAIEALATTAGRTLYVGDTVHADVRGAQAAGMPVVQLDPFDYHDDHDHWRLPGLHALADHLA